MRAFISHAANFFDQELKEGHWGAKRLTWLGSRRTLSKEPAAHRIDVVDERVHPSPTSG
jgi:hypothetical protein